MTRPQVSVIIPAYNAEPFLADAIDSVCAQNHDSLEIIVADDGSTDRTTEVALSYGSRVRLVQRPNGGCGLARNAGVDVATGELLAFLDADDVWVEGALQARLDLLGVDPGVDGVFGLVETWYDGVAAHELQVKAGATAQGPIAGTLVIRRESFLKAGLFTDVRLGEFIEWYSRAIDAGLRFDTLQQVVLRRRLHGANITVTTPDRSAYLHAMQSIIARRRAEGR